MSLKPAMSAIDDPLEVFKSLKRSSIIDKLWDAEKEVLSKYHKSFQTSQRLAIQLPTGSGKSVIGIIILEAWRQKGKRVAILTSTRALMDDMKGKCDALGVDSVIVTGKSNSESENQQRIRNIKNYKRAQSIGIFNYWSYMKATDIQDTDVLIIDDADNFESYLLDHYSIRIPRSSDIWYQTVRKLTDYRVYQKLGSFLYGRMPEDYQAIYFPHSIEMADFIGKAILSARPEDLPDGLLADFQENKERLHTYLMFVSNKDIIFTPHICPTSLHPRLRNVPHMILMSATIGTKEMLHKRLGLAEATDMISEADLTSAIGTMGKRIVFPVSGLSPRSSVTGPVMGAIDLIAERFAKVLVLCASFDDLQRIKSYLETRGHVTITYKWDSDIATFRSSSKAVLLTAGRFFGIDLSRQACQVAILPRLPFVVGPIDSLAQEVLEDDRYATEKVAHRLVQGFGRCNRGLDDRAIYLVLDGRLAADMLGNESIFRYFPHRLRAEADYGQEFSENGGLDACISQGEKLLWGTLDNFDSEINDRMSGESEAPREGPGQPYDEEIRGWQYLSERRDYVSAARYFEQGSEKSKGENMRLHRAWLLYMSAFAYFLAAHYYKDPKYEVSANSSLEKAIEQGNSSWFNGLRIVQSELNKAPVDDKLVSEIESQSFGEKLIRTWQEFFIVNQKKQTPSKAWEAICTAITNGSHNEMCEALGNALDLMGFEVHHLRESKGKPDLLAFSIFGTKYLAVIEVKSREKRDNDLGRDEVDQVTGHRANYQKEYSDHRVFTMVVTNKENQSQTAIDKAKHNTRILTTPVLVAFLQKYWSIIEQAPKATTAGERLQLISKIPQLERFLSLMEPREAPIVEYNELEAVFSK